MVHTFTCLDRYFLLDVESGSVYEVDELTHELVKSENTPHELSSGVFSRFSDTEIAEARAELAALQAEGVLYAPTQPTAPPVYHGVVKAMCLNISHLCNLRCEYCFADGGTYRSEALNMPFSVAKAAIDFLIVKSATRRNLEVDFFGGEPLLNLDVVRQTVAYARSLEEKTGKKFRFTITTNAYALDDGAIEFFNREMYNVVLSIDGRKSVHNSVRKTAGGGESFDRALANALRFRHARGDKQYYVRGTFTALNKDFAVDALALNDYGFDQISLEPVVLPETHRLALHADDVPYLERQYELLAAEYLKRRQTEKWFNFFHFMLDLYDGPCESKRMSGCGAGNEYVAVNPVGDIYPCHQFDGNAQFKMGSVLDNSFEPSIAEFFAKNNLTAKSDCMKCWAKYYCSGGCAANAIQYGGSINTPCEVSCRLMKKRIECAIAVNSIENTK